MNPNKVRDTFEKSGEKFSVKKNMAKAAMLLIFLSGTIAGFVGHETLDWVDSNKLVPSNDKAVYVMEPGDTISNDVAKLVDTDVDNDGDSDVDSRIVVNNIMNDPANAAFLKDGTPNPGESFTYPKSYVKQKDN